MNTPATLSFTSPEPVNCVFTIVNFPLALGIGKGSETRAPMVIVSIGGIITSTIFTLFLIPVIYMTFERIKSWFAKKIFKSLAIDVFAVSYRIDFDQFLF